MVNGLSYGANNTNKFFDFIHYTNFHLEFHPAKSKIGEYNLSKGGRMDC